MVLESLSSQKKFQTNNIHIEITIVIRDFRLNHWIIIILLVLYMSKFTFQTIQEVN